MKIEKHKNFMRNIAILLPAMRMGGAEKVLLTFINDIYKMYNVTVVLNKKEGLLLNKITSSVEIIEDKLLTFRDIVFDDFKNIRIVSLLEDLLYYVKIKCRCDNETDYRWLVGRTPELKQHFDVAIAYVGNVSTQIFSLERRINATMKIAWIHGETTELKDEKLYERIYTKFNKIFAVSKVSANHFCNRFPLCSPLIEVYYNHINKEEIIEKAKYDMKPEFGDGGINIVTVSRLSPEKGCEMIPQIVHLLLKKVKNISWYIIGDGPCGDNIQKQINQLKLSNYIFLLGAKENPYPFIKKADIYVQPSYEEGYSTTICEAGILGRAIVGTSTSGGIEEQLENEKDGLIAEPTPESLADKISRLIENPDFRNHIAESISQKDFTHATQFKKLIQAIDSYFA